MITSPRSRIAVLRACWVAAVCVVWTELTRLAPSRLVAQPWL
jgi:hypothetical protein